MENILLIDGNSLVFRAFYATLNRPMRTTNGIATNAAFGFNRMLNNALKELNPKYVLIAFDTGKKTFRHEMFDDYKGTRKELPEELKVQFPIIRELIDAMGLKYYEIDGYEADDIIGSLAKKWSDHKVDILTGDKDLFQLATTNTSVWMMKTGISAMEKYTPDKIYADYQLTPKQIIDLKGLMGDPSDNIPGVKGIGEKTATTLLKEYPSIEIIYENLSDIKPSISNKLTLEKNQAILSKQLATIETDVETDLVLNDLNLEINYETLFKFYQEYEMNQFIKEIESKIDHHDHEVIYEVVTNVPSHLLNEKSVLFFDLDESDYFDLKLFGCALSNGKKTYYLDQADLLKDKNFLEYLKGDNLKYLFDVKQVYHLLKQQALPFPNHIFDILIAAYLDDNLITDWNSLANKHQLNYDLTEPNLLKEITANPELTSKKAFSLLSVAKTLEESIKEKDLEKLFYEIEQPLALVLSDMEETGILIDYEALKAYADEISLKLDKLEKQVFQFAEFEFNLNSPKQMAEVLFDKLKLPQVKKRSTAIDVLEKLSDTHEVVKYIIEYRKYQKIYSTYAEGLQKYIFDDGRIHTIYRQTLTQTGRLSSINPNLQNISVRSEEGREVRKAFIADENSVLLAADYSQIELRILADMAGETKLINAFKDNLDIHNQTASEIFLVEKDHISSEMRRQAKAVNFGIVYGISDYGLSQQLDISRFDAQSYIDRYFEIYPNIKKFLDELVRSCQTNGYVETLLKRRREIPEIYSSHYITREFGKRAAMNAPIQGTAADLIKIAMVNIFNKLNQKNLKSKLILQVHDELIFNVTLDELDIVRPLVLKEMTEALKLKVPLAVSLGEGSNWYEV